MSVRQIGRIVSVAVIVAMGVNSDGRREVLGMDIGLSEAEPFWTSFLRKLARPGLRGVKLVISDAHERIKAAVSKLLCASWHRGQVNFMRHALATPARADPASSQHSSPPLSLRRHQKPHASQGTPSPIRCAPSYQNRRHCRTMPSPT